VILVIDATADSADLKGLSPGDLRSDGPLALAQ
jgi:hypothetical protein